MKIFAALIGVTLLASGGAAHAKPSTIYVMRHLERDAGVDRGLNTGGAAQAQQLAGWFRRERPKALFVTPYRRARETVAPLAAKLGVTPTEYDPRQPETLIEAVRAANGPVLIVGHSNTVPAIVHALGGPDAPDLADDDYGRIWIVTDNGKSVQAVPLAEPQPR